MKKISLLTIAVLCFLYSCVHHGIIKTPNGRLINQFTKDHLKTGYWIEKDSISTILGINDYQDEIESAKGHIALKSKYNIYWSEGWRYYLVSVRGVYNNDRRDGEWIYRIGDTAIVKRIFYTNNTLDSMFLYSLKGKLIMEGRTDWEKDEFVYRAWGSEGRFPIYFLNTNQNWNWILRK